MYLDARSYLNKLTAITRSKLSKIERGKVGLGLALPMLPSVAVSCRHKDHALLLHRSHKAASHRMRFYDYNYCYKLILFLLFENYGYNWLQAEIFALSGFLVPPHARHLG